jgi:hypothetical protein
MFSGAVLDIPVRFSPFQSSTEMTRNSLLSSIVVLVLAFQERRGRNTTPLDKNSGSIIMRSLRTQFFTYRFTIYCISFM